MTEIEKLKVVAEFMGWNTDPESDLIYKDQCVLDLYSEVFYHSKYDWLMPVWVKFRDLDKIKNENIASIRETSHIIDYDDHVRKIGREIIYGDIESAFNKLVEAIIWYNSIKKL